MNQFENDVLSGLSNPLQKTLPSKYFYDVKGDELFVQIMNMPEYYLTKAEMQIFKEKTHQLTALLDMDPATHYDVLELGAGDGSKTIELLKYLSKNNYNFTYLPVDISQHSLDVLSERMEKELPSMIIKTQQGDYFKILNEFKINNSPKIVLFLGSNIGNLNDNLAKQFIHQLSDQLKANDKIVLGVDLMKSKDIVLPAYNDKQGITRAFNMNLLERINSELNGNFDLEQFEHTPYYSENEGIAKSYLKSKIKQTVSINGKKIEFEAGETIQTEISRKYNDQILNSIIKDSDLEPIGKIMDEQNYFADYVLKKTK
jgi:L-histidine Nalpha-methyltransferase